MDNPELPAADIQVAVTWVDITLEKALKVESSPHLVLRELSRIKVRLTNLLAVIERQQEMTHVDTRLTRG